MEKISVIIPVYKVEKYLSKCVDSVLSQTYKNLEVFLVDDGSPDNCGKICDEYAKKDERVKVIHKQNGGVSSARNAGLEVCTGDYITFVDSDDWIEPTYVEELYNAIKKYDCDVSVCGFNEVNEDGNIKCTSNYKEINVDCCKNNFYEAFFCKNNLRHYVWGILYKKNIFAKLRFPVGINYEDTYIMTDVCENIVNGIAIVKKALYNYAKFRTGSITKDISRKRFDVLVAKRRSVENVNMSKSAHKFACVYLFYSYSDLFNVMKKNKQLKKELLSYFKKDYEKYKKDLPLKTKIRFFILRYFTDIYAFIWDK